MPNKIQDLFGAWIQFDCPTDGSAFSIAVANRVWDPIGLAWVNQTQSGGGGGGSVTQGTVPWVDNISQFGGAAVSLGQKVSASSIPVVVSSDSALTIFNGTLDSGNSSTATLGANATFTGTAFDAFNQGSVLVSVFSNQNSASGGLVLQWSSDGSNWDEPYQFSFVAGSSAFNIQATERARYFRVGYTNGTVAQGSFRLQVIHRITAPSGDVVENSDQVVSTNHAQIVRVAPGSFNPLAPATASVTSSSAQVIAANALRKNLIVMNLGSVNVSFGLGSTAINNGGITLTPNGTWVMDTFTFTTAAINAICSSSSTLAIQEYS